MDLIEQSRARKANAELRLKFYQSRQNDDLFEQIKRRWASPEDFRLFFINVVRKIVDKRAAVYMGTPYRTFEGMDQDSDRSVSVDRRERSAKRRTG